MIESARLLREIPERTEYDPELSFYSSEPPCNDAREAESHEVQVSSLMDSLLERPEGATWSELSEKAQALADRLGHKTKWTVGAMRVHAQSRDQATTGRWANLTLEEFEDKSGGRLIDMS